MGKFKNWPQYGRGLLNWKAMEEITEKTHKKQKNPAQQICPYKKIKHVSLSADEIAFCFTKKMKANQ